MAQSSFDPGRHKWREVTGEPDLSYLVRHDYTILGEGSQTVDVVHREAGFRDGTLDRLAGQCVLRQIADFAPPGVLRLSYADDVRARSTHGVLSARKPANRLAVLLPVGDQPFHRDIHYDLQILIENLVEEPVAGVIPEEGDPALRASSFQMR